MIEIIQATMLVTPILAIHGVIEIFLGGGNSNIFLEFSARKFGEDETVLTHNFSKGLKPPTSLLRQIYVRIRFRVTSEELASNSLLGTL